MKLLVLFAIFCADKSFEGRVVSVADGDTLTVLVDGMQVKVRLEGIDAPERKQPFGTRARERLVDICHNRDVRVCTTGKDKYGRTLGTVFVDGINVNEALVECGLAWHYVRFSTSKELARLEREARAAKRGLWADADPVPPWVWRRKSPAK